MTRETRKLIDFINDSPEYLAELKQLRAKHNNYKDFSNLVLNNVVAKILNTEKKFFDYNRSKVDIFVITNVYF